MSKQRAETVVRMPREVLLPDHQKRWQTALGWWAVAGGIGVLLRYMLVGPSTGLNYIFLLHTHSHVVLLGWTFNALFLALVATFVTPVQAHRYRRIWWGFQLAIAGMLVFFPVQGYAAGSIAFSTLHVLLSYWMCVRLWRDLRGQAGLSVRLLRWGLLFLVLSTLGPYFLGYFKARQMQHTIWYNLSIYYYLHFLYNGWFLFGCLALLVRWLENQQSKALSTGGTFFLTTMVGSAVGTLALSTLWAEPPVGVWLLGGASALVQLVAVGWLFVRLWPFRHLVLEKLHPLSRYLIELVIVAFLLKLLLQLGSALPWAVQVSVQQRHIVIAYLHLVFIGVISFFLLAWAVQYQQLRLPRRLLESFVLFFVLSELVLVVPVLLVMAGYSFMPYFYESLLILSGGMWAGVLLLWFAQFKRSRSSDSATSI